MASGQIWYLDFHGMSSGPYGAEQIRAWAQDRVLSAKSRIYNAREKNWTCLGEVMDFSGSLRAELNLRDYTEAAPVNYVAPITKKQIPWREKRKKILDFRRAEGQLESTLSRYLKRAMEAAIGKTKETPPPRPEIADNSLGLPLAPVEKLALLREFMPAPIAETIPTPLLPKQEEEIQEDESSFAFHRALFLGFFALTLLFLAASLGFELFQAKSKLPPPAAAPRVSAAVVAPPEAAPAPALEVIRAGETMPAPLDWKAPAPPSRD
jgi:hypothetical protein